MKYGLLLMLIFGMLFSGCVHHLDKPDCKRFSEYRSVVIVPVDTSQIIIGEVKMGDNATTIKALSAGISDILLAKLEKSNKFDKVTVSGDCTDKTIKIESKMYSIDHSKRNFYITVSGKISDCKTGKSFYRFEKRGNDNVLANIPREIAEDISERIFKEVFCRVQ